MNRLLPMSLPPPALSVAERISELERQQARYTYLDPEKRHRVSDPTLKAIQKKALLSFYERHQSSSTRSQTWRSEPQLAQPASAAPCPHSPPPQPPPRPHASHSARRASSASDYANGSWREVSSGHSNLILSHTRCYICYAVWTLVDCENIPDERFTSSNCLN